MALLSCYEKTKLIKYSLDKFLTDNGHPPLTEKEYTMFLKRFNRNDDKLI